jgi:PAS domain S-box-containing protein
MNQERSSKRNLLRNQARQALEQLNQDHSAPEWATFDLPRLLEELRIYQVELELQNEELVSSQMRAESALSRYRLLFSLLPLPTLLVDGFGVVQEDNDASQDWLGPVRKYQPHDLRLTQAINRNDRSRLSKLLLTLEPGRKGVVSNLSLKGFDQRERLVDLYLARLPQDFHTDPRYLVVLLDRSPDAARLAEQHLFQTLLDSTDDLIYATDVHGRLMLGNQSFFGLAGVPRERALGRKAAGFWPLSNMPTHQQAEYKVLNQGEAANLVEDVQWTSHDRPMRLTTRIFPLRNPRGERVGVGSMSRDLSFQRPNQHPDAAAWGMAALATLPWPVAVTDDTTRLLWVNPAFETASGFSSSVLCQHSMAALSSGPALTLRTSMLPWSGPMELRHAHGQCESAVVDVRALPADENGFKHWLWSWSLTPPAPANVHTTNTSNPSPAKGSDQAGAY